MAKRSEQEQFDPGDAQQRTETALRAASSTLHKTYEESKIGERSGAKRKSLGRRKLTVKKPIH